MKRKALLVILAAVALLSAGCGVEAPQPVDIELPEKDFDRWVMPLDSYMPSSDDYRRELYASALMIQKCLDKSGLTGVVPAPEGVSRNVNLVRPVFNEELASRYGYASPADVDALSEFDVYLRQAFVGAAAEKYNACGTDPAYAAPAYDNHQLNFANQMAQAAHFAAVESPAVTSKAKEWRECLMPSGFGDLPDDPGAMPTREMMQRVRTSGPDDDPLYRIVVSPAEKELALADARCRARVGYEEARYAEEWQRQVSLLSENVDALESLRGGLEQKRAEIEASIARSRSDS